MAVPDSEPVTDPEYLRGRADNARPSQSEAKPRVQVTKTLELSSDLQIVVDPASNRDTDNSPCQRARG